MTIPEIIAELDGLKKAAELRSRLLVEDGRVIGEAERAKSAGYADAYGFCLFRLRECERQRESS